LELGIWTGKTLAQAKEEDLALYERFRANSWDAVPEAESSAELSERARRVWRILRDEAAGAEKVIAVTHHGIIQWLFKVTLNYPSWFPLFPVRNCGLFRLRVEPLPGGQTYTAWDLQEG
jgi:probable phosphoglycerate mutase